MNGIIVRIEKINHHMDGPHPNFIDIGYTKEGMMLKVPTKGEPFYVGNLRTSKVVEIIDENTFRTKNSTYKWEIKKP